MLRIIPSSPSSFKFSTPFISAVHIASSQHSYFNESKMERCTEAVRVPGTASEPASSLSGTFESMRHAAVAMFKQRTRDLTQLSVLQEQSERLQEEVATIESVSSKLHGFYASMEAELEEGEKSAKVHTATLKELQNAVNQVSDDQQLCCRTYAVTERVCREIHCFVSALCRSESVSTTGASSLCQLMEKGRVVLHGRSFNDFNQGAQVIRRMGAAVMEANREMRMNGLYLSSFTQSCGEWRSNSVWEKHEELHTLGECLRDICEQEVARQQAFQIIAARLWEGDSGEVHDCPSSFDSLIWTLPEASLPPLPLSPDDCGFISRILHDEVVEVVATEESMRVEDAPRGFNDPQQLIHGLELRMDYIQTMRSQANDKSKSLGVYVDESVPLDVSQVVKQREVFQVLMSQLTAQMDAIREVKLSLCQDQEVELALLTGCKAQEERLQSLHQNHAMAGQLSIKLEADIHLHNGQKHAAMEAIGQLQKALQTAKQEMEEAEKGCQQIESEAKCFADQCEALLKDDGDLDSVLKACAQQEQKLISLQATYESSASCRQSKDQLLSEMCSQQHQLKELVDRGVLLTPEVGEETDSFSQRALDAVEKYVACCVPSNQQPAAAEGRAPDAKEVPEKLDAFLAALVSSISLNGGDVHSLCAGLANDIASSSSEQPASPLSAWLREEGLASWGLIPSCELEVLIHFFLQAQEGSAQSKAEEQQFFTEINRSIESMRTEMMG